MAHIKIPSILALLLLINYPKTALLTNNHNTSFLAPEICNNGIDDDGDGLTDCADPDCSGQSYCADCFPCEAALYQRIDDSLRKLNIYSLEFDPITSSALAFQGGYNVQDGKIYGKAAGDDSLYVQTRTGLSAIALVLSNIHGGTNSGDMDLNGNLYLYKNNNRITIIDVDAPSPISPTVQDLTVVSRTPMSIADIVYNKFTDKFYGMDREEDLYEIDIAANTITFLQDYSVLIDGISVNNRIFGAGWIDITGTMYFSRNSTGQIYAQAMDTVSKTLTTFTYQGILSRTGNNDGMSCPFAQSVFSGEAPRDTSVNCDETIPQPSGLGNDNFSLACNLSDIDYQEVLLYHPDKDWKSDSGCDILHQVSNVIYNDQGTAGNTADDELQFS